MKSLLLEIAFIGRISSWVIGRLKGIQKFNLALAMFIIVVAAALTNAPAVLLGRLVDRILLTPAHAFALALPLILLIAACIIVREGLNVARKYIVENTCTAVQRDRSIEVVQHLLRLDANSPGEGLRSGSIQGRMTRSIEGYVKLLKLAFLDLLPSLSTCCFALCVVLSRNVALAALMAGVIPIGLGLTLMQMKAQRGIRVDLNRTKEDIDGHVVELLAGLEFIRAADTIPFEVDKVAHSFERLRKRELAHHLSMAIFDAAKYLSEGIFHISVLVFSIWLATTGRATVGNVLTYTVLFAAVVTPLREIHRILDEGHESAIRTEGLMEMFAWPEDPSYRIARVPGISAARSFLRGQLR